MQLRAAFLATGWGRGRRRLAVAAVVAAATVVVWIAFPRGGVVGAFIVVVTLPLAPVAVWRAIGMWRGTVSHTTMGYVPTVAVPLSTVRWQACAPCLVLSAVSLVLLADASVMTEGRQLVWQLLFLVLGLSFLLFMGLALLVATTMGPPFLLPATMRPGRPT